MQPPISKFAQIYCEQNRLDQSKFTKKVVSRCLHFPVRLISPILISLNPDMFEADYELVSHTGTLKSSRKLEQEIRQFNADYRNRGMWRGLLRQRVSTHRLRKLFRDAMTANGSDLTTSPFPTD
jgi:hypothetical protein